MRVTAQHLRTPGVMRMYAARAARQLSKSAKWTEVDSPSSDEFGDEFICQSTRRVSGVLW